MKFIKETEIEGKTIKKYIKLYEDAICFIFEGDMYTIIDSIACHGAESELIFREVYSSETNVIGG